MSDKLTRPARDQWDNAATHQAMLQESTRVMAQRHSLLSQVADNYREMPLLDDLHQQATITNQLITAAQAYRRDLLKLLALAGGYDRIEEA